jgi:hypothetical protein
MAMQTHSVAKDRFPFSRPLPEGPWLGRWLVVLVVGGYLLFAHGCHGDEDNELWSHLRGRLSATHILDFPVDPSHVSIR